MVIYILCYFVFIVIVVTVTINITVAVVVFVVHVGITNMNGIPVWNLLVYSVYLMRKRYIKDKEIVTPKINNIS